MTENSNLRKLINLISDELVIKSLNMEINLSIFIFKIKLKIMFCK
jgi:hypothetical protein